ncbi:unnamed protein product [Paramecium sonneborni]|uniref:Tubulin--tyrosine ligase-like protein 12 SET-like domain-containing protein n=1 Tax=Paramecium sonneborni TaxID=65129 RepID=A0A8S1NMB8_9CILI|nr:unnamed protein product [Paramecium sonneborni]
MNFQNLSGELEVFYNNHGVQLAGINFPPKVDLLEQLKIKLEKKIYDAGDYFKIVDDQEQESYVLQCTKPLKAFEQVFLIDHALSFRYTELHTAIKQVDRLKNMLKYQNKKQPLFKIEKVYYHTEDFDEMALETMKDVKPKEDTYAISFFGNNISSINEVVNFLNNYKQIKAIWLNGNPVAENKEELLISIEENCPQVELVDLSFTSNATEWVIRYVTADFDTKKANSQEPLNYLNLSGRNVLRLKNVKQIANWFPHLRVLDIKNTKLNDLEEVNGFFSLLPNVQYLSCDLEVEEVLYELHKSNKLNAVAPFLRLVNQRDIRYESYIPAQEEQNEIQFIKQNLFKLTGNYRLLTSDQMDESAVWYLMDELGSSIQHSDTPNVSVVPFLYLPNGKIDDDAVAYSILFPIKDIHQQTVFRDYLPGVDEAKFRSYRLNVWFDIPYDFILNGYNEYKKKLQNQKIVEPELIAKPIEYLPQQNIKVITDLEMITKNLTLPYVSFTLDLDEANLVFFSAGVHDDINQKYADKFINQYPHEYAIISKEKLANTVQSTFGDVAWLQETFNLQTQLPLFMGAYKTRELQHLNNLWIIKPPNMARSMDMVVTNNLDVVLRLIETGPKLAQKYIERPLTLRNRKFDLRFIVALKSIEPLSVYLYKTFWIRISNNPYTEDVNTLSIYETHFTVMNYGHKLTQIFMHEFIEEFNKEYYPHTWEKQYESIQQMVRQLFIALRTHQPDMANQTKNRSVYGMDLMIDSNGFQPKLLEMTFSPDCTRACKYTPTFYNDLFECLFFGVENQNMIQIFN